jgi:AraC-like DNA-binding protein
MKKTTSTPSSFVLEKGQFVDQKYSSYHEMVSSASQNWEYCCTYELRPNGLAGHNRILKLSNMLVSLEEAPGGIMYDVISNSGMISLAVLEYIEDKACFDRMKLRSGDIMIFDDVRPYTYISSGALRNSIVSIHRKHLGKLQPLLGKAILHKIRDKDNALQNTLHSIWDEFTTSGDSHNFQDAENRILTQIEKVLQQQEHVAPNLTSGEEIAFAVRDQVYHHMDGDFSMSNLAEQYGVSEKTLQNSFKSLFGFTPKYLIRALKLNVVRNELANNTIKRMTVMRIANKWGFQHMGHFSKNYKKLFGETPSQTLNRSFIDDISIAGECVGRQEEIT